MSVVWLDLANAYGAAANESKLDRYSELQVECQENGWSCYNMAVR